MGRKLLNLKPLQSQNYDGTFHIVFATQETHDRSGTDIKYLLDHEEFKPTSVFAFVNAQTGKHDEVDNLLTEYGLYLRNTLNIKVPMAVVSNDGKLVANYNGVVAMRMPDFVPLSHKLAIGGRVYQLNLRFWGPGQANEPPEFTDSCHPDISKRTKYYAYTNVLLQEIQSMLHRMDPKHPRNLVKELSVPVQKGDGLSMRHANQALSIQRQPQDVSNTGQRYHQSTWDQPEQQHHARTTQQPVSMPAKRDPNPNAFTPTPKAPTNFDVVPSHQMPYGGYPQKNHGYAYSMGNPPPKQHQQRGILGRTNKGRENQTPW